MSNDLKALFRWLLDRVSVEEVLRELETICASYSAITHTPSEFSPVWENLVKDINTARKRLQQLNESED